MRVLRRKPSLRMDIPHFGECMRSLTLVIVIVIICLSFNVFGCSGSTDVYRPAEPWHTGFARDIRGYFLNHGELTQRLIDSLARKLIYESYGQLHINSVVLRMIRNDKDGWTCSYQQALNSIPVYSSEIGFNIRGDGTVWSSGSDVFPDIDCPTAPKIPDATARENVIKDFAHEKFEIHEEPSLVILPERRDTVVFHLAWKIWISGESPLGSLVYFVSAANGKVLWRQSMVRE